MSRAHHVFASASQYLHTQVRSPPSLLQTQHKLNDLCMCNKHSRLGATKQTGEIPEVKPKLLCCCC